MPATPIRADNQYTGPSEAPVYTTNTIGDVNISEQLPTVSGLPTYPTHTVDWTGPDTASVGSSDAPTDTRVRFTRNFQTQELPGADGNNWGSPLLASPGGAIASVTYTDMNNGYKR